MTVVQGGPSLHTDADYLGSPNLAHRQSDGGARRTRPGPPGHRAPPSRRRLPSRVMDFSPPDLDTIVRRVSAHEPRRHRGWGPRTWEAATALVLHGRDDPEVLFIERAVRDGDPWSGDMALPGGRRHEEDPDLATTAARETREEVGIPLGTPVGRLDDQGGRTHAGVVATFVYVVDERPELVPDPREVASTVWIPVSTMLDPAAAATHRWMGVGRWPAIRYDRFTVWGLTHRTISGFFDVLGLSLPHP